MEMFETIGYSGHTLIALKVIKNFKNEESNLLPAHRYLLHEDFALLGEGSARLRQVCVCVCAPVKRVEGVPGEGPERTSRPRGDP